METPKWVIFHQTMSDGDAGPLPWAIHVVALDLVDQGRSSVSPEISLSMSDVLPIIVYYILYIIYYKLKIILYMIYILFYSILFYYIILYFIILYYTKYEHVY